MEKTDKKEKLILQSHKEDEEEKKIYIDIYCYIYDSEILIYILQ